MNDRDMRQIDQFMDLKRLDNHKPKKSKPDITRKKKKIPGIVKDWLREIDKEKQRLGVAHREA